MFQNPMKGRQARNFTTNVPKIVDLKSSSGQIFFENWRWVFMFRNDEETGAEIYTAIVSGIVTRDAPVSYWPLFSMPLLRVPEAFTTVNLDQFPSRFWDGELSQHLQLLKNILKKAKKALVLLRRCTLYQLEFGLWHRFTFVLYVGA